VQYCKKCLTPDTRPNGHFNEEGVCTPCEYYGQSTNVSFEERLGELTQIVKRLTTRHKRKRWQCCIGVSGGKDSTRQALWAREKLGINPLLVSVAYPPKQISNIGANNLNNLISLGFDTLVVGPAPILSRDLVRYAFFEFGNWCKATEMALFSGVPRVAVEKKIPLILWGENPALQVGDMGTLGTSIWDGNNLVNSNTISGGNLDWFVKVASSLDKLNMYKFPSSQEMAKSRTQTIFLGPAWPDWSAENNSAIAILNGLNFRDESADDTGDLLRTRMVDEDWTIINMLLKYYKLGFSRGTEQANALIRQGAICREEGLALAQRYDTACSDKYIMSFCRYIDISERDFWANVVKWTNKKLFDVSGGKPRPKFQVGVGLVK
jgi:N-acetyl sugar amidotransferase